MRGGGVSTPEVQQNLRDFINPRAAKRRVYQQKLRAQFKEMDKKRYGNIARSHLKSEAALGREERYNKMRQGIDVPQRVQLVNPPRPASPLPVEVVVNSAGCQFV